MSVGARRQTQSNAIELREIEAGRFVIRGDLGFSSITPALAKGDALFRRAADITLDLKGVKRTDSAGLALLVEWVRAARRHGNTITFENVPQQMMSIARMSGLEAMLPIAPHQGHGHPSD